MYRYQLTVGFNDCDAMQHVNNAMYYTYFETARNELLQLFNPDLSIENWNIIIGSTACNYLQEIHFAQNITIFSWISRIGNSSFVVEHAIQDEAGQWKARGRAILLQYDFQNRHTIPINETIREQLSKHLHGPEDVPDFREL
ncbi:thioesterase [Pullulanibacillus camelliae]|uniref:Thioesterase n=1 Tax=Pullulanibacillus camelliae TaxID=1707096 RepID=A0A8J2VMU8_9BACL|nr:thioesterase family protein [Pullulanibacillus camelliae]GGE33455.1 thioesterase [Pullulanibacillus camelliae]